MALYDIFNKYRKSTLKSKYENQRLHKCQSHTMKIAIVATGRDRST